MTNESLPFNLYLEELNKHLETAEQYILLSSNVSIESDKLSQEQLEAAIEFFVGGSFTCRSNKWDKYTGWISYYLTKDHISMSVGRKDFDNRKRKPKAKRATTLGGMLGELMVRDMEKQSKEEQQKLKKSGRTLLHKDGSLLEYVKQIFGEPVWKN
jgi:hypothetical protein